MKIAIIGQSAFASDVFKLLRQNGHDIVAVFTIPDKAGREDILATTASEAGTRVFKFPRWRLKGVALPEVLEAYQSVGAELNVMPFCSQFIPMEVITWPKHQSIVYHPSLLPRHRGASAINWTLMEGDSTAGLSVFWADDGLDTGPLLLQRQCPVEPNDTVDTLYMRFLFPEGVKAMGEAVELIAQGVAPRTVQPTEGATYDAMLNKRELCKIEFDRLKGASLHNFIRGMDKVPGAWIMLDGQATKVFGSSLWSGPAPSDAREVCVEGMSGPGLVHSGGLLLRASDDVLVNVQKLQSEETGRMTSAAKYGQADENGDLELSESENALVEQLRGIWKGILRCDVDQETDFFKCGAGSMDVIRLVEEVKDSCGLSLENEDVYMSTVFEDFAKTAVLRSRGGSGTPTLVFDPVVVKANGMDVSFATQLFINNQFVDSSSGKTVDIINPTDESVICKVHCATPEDVNRAVQAAKAAFEDGEWGRMSARDRGKLMYRLADLMDQHREELATIESLDSGAVYTLALKTHIGMSVETFRYFAGWCDKIHGSTVPVSHARPRRNLSFTRKEPIGVCALITPWNYPLMMVSWKSAACLAAGNTLVLKPAQVCPLTALKLAELAVHAGFPPGVFNVLPGSGTVVGQALCDHPDVRKVGFTGSTEVGRDVMRSCAVSNIKRCSLELGGKSPLIIFADCDMDMAVRQGMNSVFFNKGENCIAAGRLFVEESIHEQFVERVVSETKKIVIGDPLDRRTSHGPQNHRRHMEKLLEYVAQGEKEGARLVYGGRRLDRPGFFLEPTVFVDVDDQMFVAKEESFGPIMLVSKFKDGDVDGVLRRANGTEYGLASGVFTRDLSKALRVSEGLQAGTCFVNCYNKTDVAAPFGGCKQSGFGKDLGEEALKEYLHVKCITVEY